MRGSTRGIFASSLQGPNWLCQHCSRRFESRTILGDGATPNFSHERRKIASFFEFYAVRRRPLIFGLCSGCVDCLHPTLCSLSSVDLSRDVIANFLVRRLAFEPNFRSPAAETEPTCRLSPILNWAGFAAMGGDASVRRSISIQSTHNASSGPMPFFALPALKMSASLREWSLLPFSRMKIVRFPCYLFFSERQWDLDDLWRRHGPGDFVSAQRRALRGSGRTR